MLNNLFTKKNEALVEENEYPSITEWAGEKDLENQLALDVYQTPTEIIIKADIAGVKPEDLKISLHNDLLTIKCHKKENSSIKEEDYFYKECYYGSFSRSIILPAEVDNHKVDAALENGVLIITLHKTDSSQIKIRTNE
jgi:Molecular chaperone (small heat shock protein)